MPTVPRYESRIQERPLPSGELPTPPASAFGVQTGNAIAGVGAQLERAGTTGLELLSAEARAAKDRADENALTEADNNLATWEQSYLHDPEKGVLNTKGKNAAGILEPTRDEFTKQADTIAQGLVGNRQKDAFHRRVLDRWQRIDATLQQHTAQQLDAFETQETQRGADLATSEAIQNFNDPARVNAAMQDGLAKIRSYARRNGMGSATKADLELKLTTGIHEGVIDRLLATDQDKAAQVWFDETKDQISGEAQTKILKALSAATTEGEALRTATDLWTKLGPKGDDDPVELDKMEDAARDQYADDPKLLKATMSYLRERVTAVEAGRKQRDDANLSKLWQAVTKGAPLAQVQRLPEYLHATGRVQAQISDYILQKQEHEANRAYQAVAHANALESLAYTREQRVRAEQDRQGMYMYFQYAKPEVLARMTSDQIWNLTPQIGEHHVAQLLQDQQAYQRDADKLQHAVADRQVIDEALSSAGIDPTPPDSNPDLRGNVAEIRSLIQTAQRTATSITKKPLSNDELSAIAKQVIGRQALSERFLSSLRGYGTQSLADVTIDSIPSAAKAKLKQNLIGRGVTNPTDRQIINAWLEAVASAKQ